MATPDSEPFLAVALAVLLLLAGVAVWLSRRFSDVPGMRRLVNLLFPVSQMLIIAYLFWCIFAFDLPQWLFVLAVALGVACCPIDVLLFRALHKAEGADEARERARLLEEQVEAQRAYRVRLHAAAQEAEDVQKDVLRQLDAVDAALERRQGDRAAAELGRAVDLMGLDSARWCQHRAVDALVAMKAATCQEAGVLPLFELDVPADVPFTSVELCAVFSNLLDNALAACAAVEEGARFISMRSRVRGHFLVVECRNSCVPEGGEAPGKRAASGRGLSRHGWGLSIIRAVAERHGGSLATERQDGEFRATVVLGLRAASGAD